MLDQLETPAASQTMSETKRVVVLDNIAPEGLAILDAADGIEYEVHVGLAGDELKSTLENFDGAVCRSGVKITGESLEGNRRLKAIVRAGVGTDNIDKPAATRAGIVVMNTPTGNTVSTAEHTMALMLGLSRNVGPAYASLASGKWDRKKFQGSELRNKTLGVVGLGRIGQTVAEKASAFEMKIAGYDPFLSKTKAEELGIQLYESVDEMLPHCDYLTVHTPLTPETEGLISEKQVGLLKKGARLVNCARGGIYDEAALIAGLESGHLGGVALDVYPNEPCVDSPLFQMPNTLCTPHLGASTAEAQKQVALEAVELLIGYLLKSEIKHAVNTISMDPKTLDRMRPYLNVAYRLGVFCSQWQAAALDSCELNCSGEIANEDIRIVTAAFCAGLLQNALDDVNIVNSETTCRDRGLDVQRQSQSSSGPFASLISVKATSGDQVLEVAGTVFGTNMPRMVLLQGNPIEAFIDGKLLVFYHKDVPGVIANIGNVLAEESINIAQMAVGRVAAGGEAFGVLNLDSNPSEAALAKLVEDGNVFVTKLIELPAAGELPEWLA